MYLSKRYQSAATLATLATPYNDQKRPNMYLRLTQERDLAAIDHIFALGRERQHSEGNYSQWHEGYPTLAVVREDIKNGTGWVCVSDDDTTVLGTLALSDHEEVYDHLQSGAWRSEQPYKVIHRMGTLPHHGAGIFMLQELQARYPYLRVDTFAANKSMLSLLHKAGFVHCGVAYYEGYGEMQAFDYLRSESSSN